VARLRVAAKAIEPAAAYTLVTTEYLADNGSGFAAVAASKRSALGTEADPLDIVLAALRERPVCGSPALPCLDPELLQDGRISVSAF
jgi:hypothetical protein